MEQNKITHKRFTKAELNSLYHLIRLNPDNLQRAFRMFCIKYPDRTVKGVTIKYYSLKKQNKLPKDLFIVASTICAATNSKNSSKVTYDTTQVKGKKNVAALIKSFFKSFKRG